MKIKSAIIVAFLVFILAPFSVSAAQIGWITDMHICSFNKHSSLSVNERSDLTSVFNTLKNQGISDIIFSGDNVYKGNVNCANELKAFVAQEDMNPYWAKGNTDSKKSFPILNSPQGNYYFFDSGNTRIIVLDTSSKGKVSSRQLVWLKETLLTNKKVIVVSHRPLLNSKRKPAKTYKKVVSALEKNGNVELVIYGHIHTSNASTNINGIRYKSQNSFLLRHEASYLDAAFATIDLDDFNIERLGI